MTTLIMTSFPTCDKSFSFQPCILAHVYSFTLVKASFLLSANKRRKSQIFFIVLYSWYIKSLFDNILCLCINILAKKQSSFLLVYNLTRCHLIIIQQRLNFITFLQSRHAKDKTIICKKQVSKFRPIPTQEKHPQCLPPWLPS